MMMSLNLESEFLPDDQKSAPPVMPLAKCEQELLARIQELTATVRTTTVENVVILEATNKALAEMQAMVQKRIQSLRETPLNTEESQKVRYLTQALAGMRGLSIDVESSVGISINDVLVASGLTLSFDSEADMDNTDEEFSAIVPSTAVIPESDSFDSLIKFSCDKAVNMSLPLPIGISKRRPAHRTGSAQSVDTMADDSISPLPSPGGATSFRLFESGLNALSHTESQMTAMSTPPMSGRSGAAPMVVTCTSTKSSARISQGSSSSSASSASATPLVTPVTTPSPQAPKPAPVTTTIPVPMPVPIPVPAVPSTASTASTTPSPSCILEPTPSIPTPAVPPTCLPIPFPFPPPLVGAPPMMPFLPPPLPLMGLPPVTEGPTKVPPQPPTAAIAPKGNHGAKFDPRTLTSAVFHYMRLAPADVIANCRLGWFVLESIWSITPDQFDRAVINILTHKKTPRQAEEILLTMAAVDLSNVRNLSAFACTLIKIHESTSQVCMRFLAGMCPEQHATAEECQCSYVHPENTHGWNVVKQKWNLTYRNIDFAALSYLCKKRAEDRDAILIAFSEMNLKNIDNLSAYLSRTIRMHESCCQC